MWRYLLSWAAASAAREPSILRQPEPAHGSSRRGGVEDVLQVQTNCKFNDCVHEYLITHLS